MDDEEEIQSHPSPASRSLPRANGRIKVTLAALALSNSLALALLIQQSSKGNMRGGGDDDINRLVRREVSGRTQIPKEP
ncbi:uncharacterized protein HKW66_Vig0132540 [Vigna angularis]|uniref:Uncharacterized protein n=1 Tax=Phaseolus angularis TaxID=3914 RepID=A0A8T0K5M1_PHAAN|nr:uncharacterized protein HKW66_Vig0132540 [Vigna angularis]